MKRLAGIFLGFVLAGCSSVDRIELPDEIKVTEAAADNAINVASEADQAAYGEIAAQIRENVLAEIAGKGIDAQAAYDMVRTEMAGN